MKKLWRSIYFSNRFYSVFIGLAGLLAIGYSLPVMVYVSQALLVAATLFLIADFYFLYRHAKPLRLERIAPEILSNGSEQAIVLKISNQTAYPLEMTIVDELPFQFEKRDFTIETSVKPGELVTERYIVRPTVRGEYAFGNTLAFIRSRIGFVKRRIAFENSIVLRVYPSIIQMKEIELMAFTKAKAATGLKKIRRIGHSYEFEQIKAYVPGDDVRAINWKATSRHNQLMVNQYEDEKSQNVYCIIDKSRRMRLPFAGMTLMDYAVNSALAISNIVIRKYDKAGLITFSDKLGGVVPAETGRGQLQRILETLYNEEERQVEADFEMLYYAITRIVRRRSLLLLYTNFEHISSLQSVLPVLRKISKRHLLVMVVFRNEEVEAFSENYPDSIRMSYLTTVAKSMLFEKQKIIQTIRQYGIQVIFTAPKHLSVNAVNKYLELKARGLI